MANARYINIIFVFAELFLNFIRLFNASEITYCLNKDLISSIVHSVPIGTLTIVADEWQHGINYGVHKKVMRKTYNDLFLEFGLLLLV